jgi:hypothetical protein
MDGLGLVLYDLSPGGVVIPDLTNGTEQKIRLV